MTPSSELDRLFRDIPRPDPLETTTLMLVRHDGEKLTVTPVPMRRVYVDPVDADETNHGPCAQGDCDE